MSSKSLLLFCIGHVIGFAVGVFLGRATGFLVNPSTAAQLLAIGGAVCVLPFFYYVFLKIGAVTRLPEEDDSE